MRLRYIGSFTAALLTFLLLTTLSFSKDAGANPNAGYKTYIVTDGDCLWLIANRFGTSVEAIMEANSLQTDLILAGQELLIPAGGAPADYPSVSRGYSNWTRKPLYGELVSWWTVDSLFPRGSTAVLQDFETGRQFSIYRLFGANHADCEPLTAQDSQIMRECFGGQWSWDRRPAILLIGGRAIACSMAGMPHGTSQDIYGNDFDGHFDLHFLHSRTHRTDVVDPDHQAAVYRAAGY